MTELILRHDARLAESMVRLEALRRQVDGVRAGDTQTITVVAGDVAALFYELDYALEEIELMKEFNAHSFTEEDPSGPRRARGHWHPAAERVHVWNAQRREEVWEAKARGPLNSLTTFRARNALGVYDSTNSRETRPDRGVLAPERRT